MKNSLFYIFHNFSCTKVFRAHFRSFVGNIFPNRKLFSKNFVQKYCLLQDFSIFEVKTRNIMDYSFHSLKFKFF